MNYITNRPNIESLVENSYLILDVSEEVIDKINRIFSLGKIFFHQELAIRSKNCIHAIDAGWQKLGKEYSITSDRPDLSESFWVSLSTDKVVKNDAIYNYEALQLHNEMIECIKIYLEIEKVITRSIKEFFTITDANIFTFENNSDLQLLFYQPIIHDRDLLQDTHDDGTYISILKSDNPGLEYLGKNGEYKVPKLEKNQLFVMPGELMYLFTGGKIKSLVHRVTRHEEQSERFALGYFMFPDIESNKAHTPWIVDSTNSKIDIDTVITKNKEKYLVEED